jgi:hypothetical protein
MSYLSRCLKTTALCCALSAPLTAPVQAQSADAPLETPVTFWNSLSLDGFLGLIIQSAMPSLRFFADLRYDQIDVDSVRNSLALIGVDIRPYLPYVAGDACAARADRIVISGQPIDRQTGYGFDIALDGITIGFDCLPPDVRPFVGMAGIETLRIDRAHILADYDFASGGATVQFGADMDNLIALTGSADLDYISYRMDLETEEIDPTLYINSLAVTLENRGIFDVAKRIAPAEMLAPDAATSIIGDALTGLFTQMNGPASDTDNGGLIVEQDAFINQARVVARSFLENPGLIVLEADLPQIPMPIGGGDFEDPKAIFAKLTPVISTAPKAISNAISANELKQAIDGLLPIARNLDVGRALLTGIGAPRNETLGLRLLDPLAKQGNADAIALMAVAMADDTPDVAYRLALSAASNKAPGALALLSDLEGKLTLPQILDIQDAMLGGGGPVASNYASIGEMRRAARAHMIGNTRIRSYRAAYYWASVGAATGDAASARIRDEIDTKMRIRGADAIWSDVRTSLENGVLRDWVGRDLPGTLHDK